MRLASSTFWWGLLAASLALGLTSCAINWSTGSLLEIDCFESLCGWQVERGGVERTGSWHPKEYAFSITGADSSISRTVSLARTSRCLHVTYVGEIAPTTTVQLEFDYNDDGRTDTSATLPAVRWKWQEVHLRAPTDYRRLRIRMTKTGEGSAKLAQFAVGYDELRCENLPPVTLQDGAECGLDLSCASNRCYLGRCSACGGGTCTEGEACRNTNDCLDGACAAGVCRACAKTGTCGTSDGCSTSGQCSSNSCVPGATPSMATVPAQDGTCGDCDEASDCASGHCVSGRCSECASDTDCSAGLACQYIDRFDALERRCSPRLTSPLPRGALCENDSQCEGALACGAGDGRAKRCGVACGKDGDCSPGLACIIPGARSAAGAAPANYVTQPRWNELSGRIATCWPVGQYAQPCELHQQCASLSSSPTSCCENRCGGARADLDTGMCLAAEQLF